MCVCSNVAQPEHTQDNMTTQCSFGFLCRCQQENYRKITSGKSRLRNKNMVFWCLLVGLAHKNSVQEQASRPRGGAADERWRSSGFAVPHVRHWLSVRGGCRLFSGAPPYSKRYMPPSQSYAHRRPVLLPMPPCEQPAPRAPSDWRP